ncbi:MAG: methylmalonyl-CoA mutase family protein [Deltaproteobacteria bacterium]|nr:methylmalonyl-CoA mutase family protein [Deltaproteobacteria bacterium]MCX5828162.1 methylmalonyl-CoA mutase family protein [Deltaproteobacteria bacterium]
MESNKRMFMAREHWEKETRAKYIKEKPERRPRFVTDAGIEVRPLYSPLDLAEQGFDYEKDLGFPGEYPYTRGINPSMNRGEPFRVRIYSGFGTPEDSNERYRKILAWGADEVQIASDLPSQIGYDSDHIMSKGEIGRVGVSINSLQDMEILFAGIPLNSFKRVGMMGNSIGPIALALLIALGEKQGLKPEEYVVDLQNDPIKEYIARGTYIFPMDRAVHFACDAIEYCAQKAAHWYPMHMCVNHINASGSGSTKGMAFAMSNGLVYIDDLLRRGLTIDQIAPLLILYVDEREDFFVTIGNCRAARKVWAGLMRDRFGAKDSDAMAIKMNCYSHGGETLKEPKNNIVRIAFAALAYALGGVQFLQDASYDEAMATPNDEACKVSIRTLQIIAHELGFSRTVDPLGGSYYLESLTKEIEQGILAEMVKVEELGGSLLAIEKGYCQGVITRGAVRRQREFETGERVSVGVNIFKSDENLPPGSFRVNPQVEERQLARLRALKAERDGARVRETLSGVREAALRGQNMVEPVLEAVRAYATVGEICQVLREIYGEHQVVAQF